MKFYSSIIKGITACSIVLLGTTAQAQYCTPFGGALANCTNGTLNMRINGVTTTGGILNINNSNNACTGYTYYSGTNNTVRQNAGGNISFTVNFSNTNIAYPYRIVVWVDWNRDNVFDNTDYNITTNPGGERMAFSPATLASSPYTVSFAVPNTAKHGLTRMRIRAGTRGGTSPYFPPNTITGTDPCAAGDFAYGEVEDYDFDVINPCTIINAVNFNNLTDRSVSITWSPKPNAMFYEYQVTKTQGFPGHGNYFTNKTTVNLPDASIPIECNTKYYVYVRAVCDDRGGTLPEDQWDKGPWREETFTTPPCCYTPGVVISNITGSTAIASWTPVPSVVKYEYVISADMGMTAPQSGDLTTQTSILLKGLSPTQDYKFWLRAWCSPTPTSDWGYATFLTQPGLGINTNSSGNTFMNIYPNPAKDVITVDIPGVISGNAHLVLTDMVGKTIRVVTVISNKISLDVSGLANGLYHIKYTDANHTSVKSIHKQ